LAKDLNQILTYLSDAGNTAVLTCRTKKTHFADMRAVAEQMENAWYNLPVTTTRLVLILERQQADQSDGNVVTATVQRS